MATYSPWLSVCLMLKVELVHLMSCRLDPRWRRIHARPGAVDWAPCRGGSRHCSRHRASRPRALLRRGRQAPEHDLVF